ncbi:hypothetical protein PQR70_17415 [Paraburkholderia madseniana]|uniref:Uncharacterized protein n=1 Tax=Paraburkholderia madseniana TaxID=2599607 RepID=A0AAP5BIR6_9BURK|nr:MULTISPECIES: hypothetical protein [Paraburkholderia]MCX4148766.1 hypothetical protein [Paraburkholderia madseniana]MDN7151704.1 hypothetical protein [Paraburkholderia sp. WS6]MDQ6410584.1 hypothetical protein [Paraburkholderia madseniana]
MHGLDEDQNHDSSWPGIGRWRHVHGAGLWEGNGNDGNGNHEGQQQHGANNNYQHNQGHSQQHGMDNGSRYNQGHHSDQDNRQAYQHADNDHRGGDYYGNQDYVYAPPTRGLRPGVGTRHKPVYTAPVPVERRTARKLLIRKPIR